MVGYLKTRFIRISPIPKELLCTVCDEILNDPYNCSNCSSWFCKSCLVNICPHSQSCDHKYIEANKYLKNKIDEMEIKCEFWIHGCLQIEKVSEINKHEKFCQFKKFTCHHPDCMNQSTKKEAKKHSANCSFSIYECKEGCGKKMKLFERNNHNCVEWLKNVIENHDIKYRVLKEENEEIRNNKNDLKNYFNKELKIRDEKIKFLNEEIQNLNEKIEKIQLLNLQEKKELDENYKNNLKKINEKATNQINHIRQKSDEQMLYLSKNLKNSMNSYLENTKDNLFNFNTRLQADSNDLIMHQTPVKSKINSSFQSNSTKKSTAKKQTKNTLSKSFHNKAVLNE